VSRTTSPLGADTRTFGRRVTPFRVGVVGCGLMGAGIAEVASRAGCSVVVYETDDAASQVGASRVEASLASAVRRGRLTNTDRDAAVSRLRYSSDPESLADRELVVEAVPEIESVKVAVFEMLDRVVVDPDAILASNTSSIPIMKLAMATKRPGRVLGLHFFNPVPVLNLVELVTSLLTEDDVAANARVFVADVLDKHVIESQDRAGFIVNTLLIPYLLSAVRMLESGFATLQDIDDGMVRGCAHPMGPLALADLIGLDTTVSIADSLYAEFKEPLYAPPPVLLRMVDAGLLGRKSGRGFYDYSVRAAG
jgi:3-hydroxybutyryl-CoA dehydrogenase